MSFSVWEVTEQNAKGDESVRNIRTTFHLGKMEGEGKAKNMWQGNRMSMDTKSSTGSEGANGSEILKT